MTWICYIGIEISARIQYALLGIELGVLAPVLRHRPGPRVHRQRRRDVAAPVARRGSTPSSIPSLGALATGTLLAVFIYWGFDTAVSVNEETKDARKTPGRAAVTATLVLLVVYVLVTTADPGLRRHRHEGHRARRTRTTRTTCSPCSARRCSAPARSAASPCTC